jgi:hypothetical protein
MMYRIIICFIAFLFCSDIYAKMEKMYLSQLVSQSEFVVQVKVKEFHLTKDRGQSALLRITSTLAGSNKKGEIQVTLKDDKAADSPKLSDGKSGTAFIVNEKGGIYKIIEFIPTDNIQLANVRYFCKSPAEDCKFKTSQELQAYVKNQNHTPLQK